MLCSAEQKGADSERRAAIKEQQRLWQLCCPAATHPRVWGRKPFSPCLFLGSPLDRAVVRMTLGIHELSPVPNHRWMSKNQFGDQEEDRCVERLLHVEWGVRNDWWDPGLHPQPCSGSVNNQSRFSPVWDVLFFSLKAIKCLSHVLPTSDGVNTAKWASCILIGCCGHVTLWAGHGANPVTAVGFFQISLLLTVSHPPESLWMLKIACVNWSGWVGDL